MALYTVCLHSVGSSTSLFFSTSYMTNSNVANSYVVTACVIMNFQTLKVTIKQKPIFTLLNVFLPDTRRPVCLPHKDYIIPARTYMTVMGGDTSRKMVRNPTCNLFFINYYLKQKRYFCLSMSVKHCVLVYCLQVQLTADIALCNDLCIPK